MMAQSSLPEGCNITALLNRSQTVTAGWRFGDPGLQSLEWDEKDTTIPWYPLHPSDLHCSIGVYVYAGLYDAYQEQFSSTHIVCELSDSEPSTAVEIFSQNWPYKMQSLFLNDNLHTGCFRTFMCESVTECGLKCKREPSCRALYYHMETGQCWLSLYVDSLLPSNMTGLSGNWMRYGRPEWT
ncbi:unnamed protein product [Echinostoma caproni]|uniref:Apple domain-containing protein n=1 Tax=Echinostoma caproni TaxID=27848 RepID=A0A183AF31_9TREM|nr:unnamed protein product [Echinostoma caproni]